MRSRSRDSRVTYVKCSRRHLTRIIKTRTRWTLLNEEQGQLLHRAIKIRTCFLEHAHTATFTAFQQITTNMVLCGSNLISDRLWNTRRIIAFHVVGPWLRPRYSSRFMRNISTAAITTECYWNSTENLVVWKKKKRAIQLQIRFLVCVTYSQPWNTGSLEQSSFLEVLFTNVLENNKDYLESK